MSVVVINTPESTSQITNLTAKHIQQAAVDISLENVWEMSGLFQIDEDKKVMRATNQLKPDADGYFELEDGKAYEISFDHDISIGHDEAALIVTRSTLVRNGLTLVSGLWDPSFVGRGGCCLHVKGGPARIKQGTRVGQFVLWKVLNAQGKYDGDYGLNADGSLKAMEAKYHATLH